MKIYIAEHKVTRCVAALLVKDDQIIDRVDNSNNDWRSYEYWSHAWGICNFDLNRPSEPFVKDEWYIICSREI